MAEEDKEIYRYPTSWMPYCMNWSVSNPQRLGIGSFLEDHTNKIQILELPQKGQHEFQVVATADHPYPATKMMFQPVASNTESEVFATTADFLRIWKLSEGKIELVSLLNNNKSSEFCAPVTSFDWNQANPNMIGTSSIDTTCTIWDIETQQAKTQLIAHDKEVYDMAFGTKSEHMFASVGADGSMRMFDLRSLEHSTIIYESPDLTPLLRLSWNRQDPNYIACLIMSSKNVEILDIRVPSFPVAELTGHKAAVNALAWAPQSSYHLCTGADDGNALIWDLSLTQGPSQPLAPILSYEAKAEINNIQWSERNTSRIAVAVETEVQILKV